MNCNFTILFSYACGFWPFNNVSKGFRMKYALFDFKDEVFRGCSPKDLVSTVKGVLGEHWMSTKVH